MSAAPRPAATVVVLRAASGAPEILMVRRTRGAAFMADAWVFPGGRVDDSDGPLAGDDAAVANTFARAAARELAEEAAIELSAGALVWFAHWITPSVEPKRYDTRFFLAVAPADAAPARADGSETTEARWAPAAAWLAEHEAGQLKLPPPTFATLEDLAAHPTVDAAVAWARALTPAPIQPKLVMVAGPDGPDTSLAIYLPWDPDYPSQPGEGQPIAADHPLAQMHPHRTRFVLENGRWWGRPPVE